MTSRRLSLALTGILCMAAAASGAAYAEGTRPAVTFGRSLDIEGTPLRLARAFNPGFTLARPGTRPSGLPLKANWISSGFGMRFHPFGGGAKFHGGLDFAAPTGTAVHATAPGVISFAGWNGNYGLCVVIDHGGGTSTLFGHLSAVTSVPGTPVGMGDLIGRVGSTGRSTGPHLHYEVRLGGRPVDPRSYL